MITGPKESKAHLFSAWTAGIALLFLGIGLQGAVTPLLPVDPMQPVHMEVGDEVSLEEFAPPAPAPADDEAPLESLDTVEEEEVEIPPLPVIETPLTPPEMAEITPQQPLIEPPPRVQESPPPPKPKPKPEPKPKARPRPVATKAKPSAKPGAGAPDGSGAPTLFSGGGQGRFPSPAYPSSARSSRMQGSVRLLVVVEPSGMPSSISVSSSSGFQLLDEAASDHISRRWRWPAGDVRHYLVPVRFVLR